jgi:hypothetical protein
MASERRFGLRLMLITEGRLGGEDCLDDTDRGEASDDGEGGMSGRAVNGSSDAEPSERFV